MSEKEIILNIDGDDPDFICQETDDHKTLFQRKRFNSSYLMNFINNHEESYYNLFDNLPTCSTIGYETMKFQPIFFKESGRIVPSIRKW